MRRSILVLSALALAACARPATRHAAEPAIMQQGSAARVLRGRVTDHVIVISIDGLRPDAIAKYDAKTLERLMAQGRYSLTAQTISISNTLPSHTSMLTGVDADQHKITWNRDRSGQFGHVEVPTVFGLARAQGYTTAAFYSKSKFHHIDAPETIGHVRGPKGGLIPWNSGKVTDLVVEHLREARPNLTFVHLADADFAGHNFGWMQHTYGMAVRQSDIAVARILDAADDAYGRGNYTVLITSDHGGHGKGHGTTDPLDTTIPWIVSGAGVRSGEPLSGIRTMDTAATVLWMLNIAPPAGLVGRPVTDAFAGSSASR
jgi:predicted AlkP superfamily pyrophosphatase or phosphodiesterase